MSTGDVDVDLVSQIRDAIDPAGEMSGLLDVVRQGEPPKWLREMAPGVQAVWAELASHGQQYDDLLASMQSAVRALVPRGWAVFNMDTDVVHHAVALVDNGRVDEADELLATQWEGAGEWRTRRICDRIGVMAAGDGGMHRLFQHRARLMHKAKLHHDEGRFEASIPLIHSQMEGIVMDVTEGRKFFTKGNQKANLVDATQLVSIESCLAALQATYGQDVSATQAAGSMSRHGIVHGRELAYDTHVNSAKSWSVVDALVEWAMPLARAEVDRRRAIRQSVDAGSAEVDERGRRVDDREFAETRDALRLLATSSMGWWRQRREFRIDLIDGVYTDDDFSRRGVPIPHGLNSGRSNDGQSIWFWRTTVSGWVLAISLAVDGDDFVEWLYSGPVAPTGSPQEDPACWGPPFGTPPEWS